MKTTRKLLLVFIVLLLLSGITAFPLRTEISWLVSSAIPWPPLLSTWLIQVNESLQNTPELVFYGTDWLAFAHIVIGLFFIPVYNNPVRYRANLIAGMVACVGVLPLAFICGPVRGIPFFHQLIDCSFGVVGFVLLYMIYNRIPAEESTLQP